MMPWLREPVADTVTSGHNIHAIQTKQGASASLRYSEWHIYVCTNTGMNVFSGIRFVILRLTTRWIWNSDIIYTLYALVLNRKAHPRHKCFICRYWSRIFILFNCFFFIFPRHTWNIIIPSNYMNIQQREEIQSRNFCTDERNMHLGKNDYHYFSC